MNNTSNLERFRKDIIFFDDDTMIINYTEAINYFKKNNFKEFDIISELILGTLKINGNIYYFGENFGLLSKDIIDYCKKLLNSKKGLIFLWPKIDLISYDRIPIFLMDQNKKNGILVYAVNKNLLIS
ncbi:MAG: hypothetical protein ACTSPY_00520 [Candidatus Helarchaeota archaeon]